jgi:hypothetical protein
MTDKPTSKPTQDEIHKNMIDRAKDWEGVDSGEA